MPPALLAAVAACLAVRHQWLCGKLAAGAVGLLFSSIFSGCWGFEDCVLKRLVLDMAIASLIAVFSNKLFLVLGMLLPPGVQEHGVLAGAAAAVLPVIHAYAFSLSMHAPQDVLRSMHYTAAYPSCTVPTCLHMCAHDGLSTHTSPGTTSLCRRHLWGAGAVCAAAAAGVAAPRQLDVVGGADRGWCVPCTVKAGG